MKETKSKAISLLDWGLHFISYAAILIVVSTCFKSFTIDDRHLYLYGLLATLIIFILNKTIKPILVKLTIPLTGLTLGLFYPIINVFILKLCDWILGPYFQINGFFTEVKGTFVVILLAILISVMNIVIERAIINPIIRRLKK
jgi:putative membrane protein